jgi:hypothetical protein
MLHRDNREVNGRRLSDSDAADDPDLLSGQPRTPRPIAA